MRADGRVAHQVFIVEDNEDDEALTVRALRKLIPTLDVRIARDGQQAIEMIERSADLRPSVILLDIKLPKLNGIEVLKVVRSTGSVRTVPTVMLTSSDEPVDLLHSYEAGASGFVRKPIEYEEYVEAVQVLGKFWLRLNMGPPAVRRAG